MVAAVSSANSLSLSSSSLLTSRWCCRCRSSITFWCVSSMAAKPRSHVACRGQHKSANTVTSATQLDTYPPITSVHTFKHIYIYMHAWPHTGWSRDRTMTSMQGLVIIEWAFDWVKWLGKHVQIGSYLCCLFYFTRDALLNPTYRGQCDVWGEGWRTGWNHMGSALQYPSYQELTWWMVCLFF